MPSITRPFRAVVSFAHQYERHFSALALVGGYAFDSYAFGRVDHAATHVVFVAYLLVAGIAIGVSHRLESRRPERQPSERTRTILSAITQFALGCLLSGFCVFYLRSASLWASWPYLLILASVFVGNEFFKRYTTRFTLSVVLYFFALFSYFIFLVPVLTAMIGAIPFIISGIAALAVFWLYVDVLSWLGRERLRTMRPYIYGGVLLVFALVNIFYFLKILPPLPLALSDAGVYHYAKRNGAVYNVTEEAQPWTTELLHIPPVVHIAPADKLYLYAAVFAPGNLRTTIVHHWEWFDPKARHWMPAGAVLIKIRGGRETGYRGYSIKSKMKPGDWRVDITTEDGRPLGRIRFAVAIGAPAQPLVAKVLN